MANENGSVAFGSQQAKGQDQFPLQSARSPARAIWNGICGRCPNCGEGRIFAGYLATNRECSECGEPLHHHRADDLPAYLNILVTGHVVVGTMMVAMDWELFPMWGLTALTAAIAVAVSALMMRPLKGAVVGLQWALRMHGFGGNDD